MKLLKFGMILINDHIDILEYDDANKIKAHIEDCFKNNDCSCKIIDSQDFYN